MCICLSACSVFRVHKKMDSHIIVIKLVPGFSDEAIMAIIQYGPRIVS